VPLLALFHGIRQTEACQLLLNDVQRRRSFPIEGLRTVFQASLYAELRKRNQDALRGSRPRVQLLQVSSMGDAVGLMSQCS